MILNNFPSIHWKKNFFANYSFVSISRVQNIHVGMGILNTYIFRRKNLNLMFGKIIIISLTRFVLIIICTLNSHTRLFIYIYIFIWSLYIFLVHGGNDSSTSFHTSTCHRLRFNRRLLFVSTILLQYIYIYICVCVCVCGGKAYCYLTVVPKIFNYKSFGV